MLLTISLAVLTAAPALPTQIGRRTASRARERMEEVHLRTIDKLDLEASYYAPKKKKSRQPAILMVHDAGQDREQVEDLAVYLQTRGYGVLTFDLRGHGANVSKALDWDAVDEKAHASMWVFALRDLEAGAEFLRTRKEIHASNLSVIGVGAGCALAVHHAVGDENTRAVVLIAPVPENPGFDLLRDVQDLEGLDTLVIVPKGQRDVALRLQSAGHKRTDGAEYIDVVVLKAEAAEIMNDRRIRNEISRWLRSKVNPRK